MRAHKCARALSSKANNRAAFPATARIVDDLRAVFGADVAVEFVNENGRTLGTREMPGVWVAVSDMVLIAQEIPAPGTKGRR